MNGRWAWTITTVVVLVISMMGTTMVITPTPPAKTPVPVTPAVSFPSKIQNVVVVFLENSNVNTLKATPYGAYLAAHYVLQSHYYGVCYPSSPNYIAFTSATLQQCGSDKVNEYSLNNIMNEVFLQGYSMSSYSENMTKSCQTGDSGTYIAHHDAYIWYSDILNNATRCADSHPITSLPADFTASDVTNLTFIEPNVDHDCHNWPLSQCMPWLKTFLNPFMNDTHADGKIFNDTVWLLQWDNPAGSSDTSGYNGTDGGNAPSIWVGSCALLNCGHPFVNDTTDYNDARTVECLLGLGLGVLSAKDAAGSAWPVSYTAFNPSLDISESCTGASAPNAPTALTVTGQTTTSISLSWSNPSGTLANDTLYRWNAASCSGTATAATSLGVATTKTVSSLTSGDTYSFEVTAWNTAGQSSKSSCVSWTIESPASQVPAAPTGLTISSDTETSVALTWTNPSGGGLLNNTVYYTDGPICVTPLTAISTSGAVTSKTITGLDTGDEYAFEVTAWNATGQSPDSNCIFNTTAQVPVAPYYLNVTVFTTTTITVDWINPGGDGFVNNTVYYIQATNCDGSMTAISAGVVTTKTVTGLVTGDTYSFEVTVWNATGQSPDSNCVTQETGHQPAAPTDLTITSFTTTNVSILWTNPSGGGLVNNTVYYAPEEPSCSGGLIAISLGGVFNAYTINNASFINSTFAIQVTAWNNTGQSLPSNCAIQNTKQYPAPPTALMSTARTNISVTLVWTNPSEGALTNNTIFYGSACNHLTTTISTITPTSGPETVAALHGNTKYCFTVTVWNSLGSSNESNFVNVTTMSNPAPSQNNTTGGLILPGLFEWEVFGIVGLMLAALVGVIIYESRRR
jgi:hypothetical protein